jgi:hypothetical protein
MYGAFDGDTVMVAPGTYHEHDIYFPGRSIVLMGTDPEDPTVVAATVVDADSSGRGFHFLDPWIGSSSVLTGLTITGGYHSQGGGIFCYNTSPTITNNIIFRNSATGSGGGIYIAGEYSEARLINNIIRENSSADTGGGIYSWSPILISGNTIVNNSAGGSGGGIRARGGPMIINNVIKDNTAGSDGGGIAFFHDRPIIEGNIFTGNSAEGNGGGIECGSPTTKLLTIANNTLTSNSAGHSGGGMHCSSSSPIVLNTIFWDNSAVNQGSEIYISAYSDFRIDYSDVKGGFDSIFVELGSTISWGSGMIDDDPLFMTYKGYDYLLNDGSPCIDTGDPSIEDLIYDWHPRWPNWLTNGERSDMGAYGGAMNKGWALNNIE